MTQMHNVLKTTRLSIWLLLCVLILAATSVYAAGNERPLAAVDVLGSPDAAVDGKFAVGTDTPGNKTLTVAGVIDFVGAGTVNNYFTQGPGNNMQIRSNVDEYNAVGNSSYAQWNMVMGASLDVFSIRRSPASSTYNEDALFWINGATGDVGIAKVDTSNGASIPFTLQYHLHVQSAVGHAIGGISTATSGEFRGVMGSSSSSTGTGVYGVANASSGTTYGVFGRSVSSSGRGVVGFVESTYGTTYGVSGESASNSGTGVYGHVTSSSGTTYGVYGRSDSSVGRGVYGQVSRTSGTNYGLYGESDSTSGRGVYGAANATSGTNYGVNGRSYSTDGIGVYGWASTTIGTNYGVYGRSNSTSGVGLYGWASATSGETNAVYGRDDSTSGNGVWGFATATSGATYGVFGENNSTQGIGVYGLASQTTGTNYGVYGRSASTNGKGVYGHAYATSGTTYGVYGESASTSGYDFYAAGAGTDYGPFTGAHEVILSESFPAEIQLGMIVSATGEAHVRQVEDGSVDLSSTLPTVKLADSTEDKAVFGVLVSEVILPEDHWYNPGKGERFASVNALGEGRVWVTDINGNIEAGDYITTSTLPGYGQRQDASQLFNYTLAKATETIDWDSVAETVTINGQEYKVYLLAVVYTSG